MSVPAKPDAETTVQSTAARDAERKLTAVRELAAAKADLTATIARQIDFLLEAYATADEPITPEEAAARARSPYEHDALSQGPQHVSWHALGNLAEHAPDQAAEVWDAVKGAAREELQTGLRAARALERTFSSPYERAQYLAILEALFETLAPKGGAEALLVQQMASALEQAFRWQHIATKRVDEESWQGDRDRRRVLGQMTARERERHEENHGWLPPRQSDAEAIEQAALIADRYQRQYLRLLRTFRDMRRVLGTVVVTGGQLNVAEQQVVVAATPKDGEES